MIATLAPIIAMSSIDILCLLLHNRLPFSHVNASKYEACGGTVNGFVMGFGVFSQNCKGYAVRDGQMTGGQK